MGVEPTQDGITAPQTVLKTAAVTGPRAAPYAHLATRTGRTAPASRLQAGTVADDTPVGMPRTETMTDPPTHRTTQAPEDAAVLARRVRELEQANARLEREAQEGRLVALALRDSEARLQDLALTTADWLWEIDAHGRYTACSDRVTDVLGYTPDEIIGRTPFDFMMEEDAASIGPMFEHMLRENIGCSELKNRNRHKDGHEVVVLTSCVPMLNDAGQLLGFRGVDKDITQRERMERSLRRQTRELGALLEAGRAMAASIDYDEVLHRVARAAGEALGTAECVIWEYSPDLDLAMFRCLWEREPVPGVAESLVGTSYEIQTHVGGLDGLRAGVVVQESRSDPDLSPVDAGSMDDWGEKTWLNVPLVLDRQLLGVMILIETQHERRFDPDEVRMAGVIGEQAAMALRNALRHRREEERNRWLRSLVSAGRAVGAAQDPDEALEEVARLATEAMQSPAAFLYEYAPDRDALVMRARWASRPVGRDDEVGAVFPVADAPQDRRALVVGEVFEESISDTGLAPEVRGLMEGFGERTLLNVPLRWRGEALGMLVLVEDEHERTFTAGEKEFMRAFGEQVTLALSTARSATTDSLTGLANHRVFYERLEQELARAERYGTPVSLLMIDIDDFKELNDTHGHPAGDEALHRLGLLLTEQLRRGIDLPARYGGEEFAVILPNTGVDSGALELEADAQPDDGAPAPGHGEGAEALAERLRAVIAERPLSLAGSDAPVRLRVSVGVASFPDMAGNMDDLVARADAALYAAKRAGKDRVEVYWRRRPEPAEAGGRT
jgi:PAS domain S-box-containing protein